MIKIDARWLTGLILLAVICCGLVLGLHRQQIPRIAAGFMREALRAQEAEQPEVVLRNLSNYLALMPNDTDGMTMYAQQLMASNQLEAAFSVFTKVQRLDPIQHDARRQLAILGLQIERYQESQTYLASLLKDFPQDSELWELNGIYENLNAKYESAQTSWKMAIEFDLHRLTAYELLADLLLTKLKQPTWARETLDQMVSNNPANPLAYLIHANFLLQSLSLKHESLDSTETSADHERTILLTTIRSDLSTAAGLSADSESFYDISARFALFEQHRDEARKLWQAGLKAFPKHAPFYLSLAELDIAEANFAAAATRLEQGLSQIPNHRELQWNYANTLIDMDRESEAQTVIEQLSLDGDPVGLARFLEARLKLKQGLWLEAIRLLETIRQLQHPQLNLVQQTDYLLAMAYGEIDARDQELAGYRRAVMHQPNWLPARLGLARALSTSNAFSQAAEEYRLIRGYANAPDSVVLDLARCLQHVISNQPTDQQDWREFQELLEQAERQSPRSASVMILRADQFTSQKEYARAAEVILEGKTLYPENIDFPIAQSILEIQSQNWVAAEKTIQAAELHFGDRVSLRLMKCELHKQSSPATIQAQLKSMLNLPESWSLQDQFGYLQYMTRQFLALNDYQEAKQQGLNAAARQPNNLSIRLLLFDVAFRSQDLELMNQTLREVRDITGDGPAWNYGEAIRCMLLAKQKNTPELLEKAQLHLAKAAAQRTGWMQIPLLRAELHLLRGDLSAATEYLLEAISLGERDPDVLYRTVMLLMEQRRFMESEQVVQKIKDAQHTLSEEFLRTSTEIAIQLKETNRAINLAEDLVRQSNRNENQLWLAQVLGETGQTERAEKILRDLVSADRENPDHWLALVRLKHAQRQIDETNQLIAEAENSIAKPLAPLAIAQCYELIGRHDDAAAKYQQALAASPQDAKVARRVAEFQLRTNRRDEAELLLNRLLHTSLDPGDRRWVIRNLAWLWSTRANPEQLNLAWELLQENLNTEPVLLADERIQALILAQRPSLKDRRQAISILEKQLQFETEAELEDRYLLARLYQSTGESRKGRAEFRKLLSLKKDDVRFLVGYLQYLLSAEEMTECELWLSQLVAVAPHDLMTIELQAQVLFVKKQYADSFELLAQAVTNVNEDSRLLWGARQFEKSALALRQHQVVDAAQQFADQAEALYQQYTEKIPAERLLLANYLVQIGQLDRALTILTDASHGARFELIESVCLSVMQQAQTTPAQLEQLESIVQQLQNTQGQSNAYKLILADLKSWRGDYASAARIYREVLKQEPENLSALNNLAIILAMTDQDHQEAIRLVTRAIERNGDQIFLLDTRGIVYLAAGMPEKALADFEECLRESETSERLFHVAAACAKLNQLHAARRSLLLAQNKGLTESGLHPIERQLLMQTKLQIGI